MKKIIPEIKIFTRRIKNNCEVVTSLLKENGISCFGVTKGVCGNPDIARAMLDGGCVGIGDSRISNLKKLVPGSVKRLNFFPFLVTVLNVLFFTMNMILFFC